MSEVRIRRRRSQRLRDVRTRRAVAARSRAQRRRVLSETLRRTERDASLLRRPIPRNPRSEKALLGARA